MPAFTCQIADCLFDFQDFGDHGFWQFWPWKLDPFRVDTQQPAQVTVQREMTPGEAYAAPGLPVLAREPSGFFVNVVHRLPEGGTRWTVTEACNEKCFLRYTVERDWSRITLREDATQSAGSAAFEFLGRMLPGILLNHGVLSLHAALVEYNDKSIALCADSGVGKTTRARLLRDKAGALILNGDRALCKKKAGRWQAYGSPWSGTSGEQLNRTAPLGALVVLQRAEEGEADSMVPLNLMQRLQYMMPHLQYPAWEEAKVHQALAHFDQLLREVPVYLLRCHPDEAGIACLLETLEQRKS